LWQGCSAISPEIVVADTRLKNHTAAQSSEVVRQNCDDAPKISIILSASRSHSRGQFFGDAIENQIQIDFAGNRNLKTWHRSLLFV
jgi:hypothetical protein